MLCPFAYRSRRLIILPVFSSLFRNRRKDDGDAKDEPGQSHESGKVVTIRPHGLASQFPNTQTFQLIERLSAEEGRGRCSSWPRRNTRR
jgi:hypothetical protein